MRLFISWSGERSKKIGELLVDLIGGTIQRIEPWMSTEMDRGTIWFNELGSELRDVADGIVCLTRENLTAPWILFEAGALARGLTSQRVYTFLIDLEPKDISPPLSQFNHTPAVKGDIFRLLKTLNSRLKDDALQDKILEREFELHWPFFEKGMNDIIKKTSAGALPQKKEKDILLEIQSSIRGIEQTIRRRGYEEMVGQPFFPAEPPPMSPRAIDSTINRRIHMAKNYLECEQYYRARSALKYALQMSMESGQVKRVSEINALLKEIDERQGCMVEIPSPDEKSCWQGITESDLATV